MDMLDALGIPQFVSADTRKGGRILDIGLSRNTDDLVSSINVVNDHVCDLSWVHYSLNVPKWKI